MKLNLTIKGTPFPKQSVRHYKGNFYKPKKIKDNELNVKAQVLNQLPKGFNLITEPIRVNKLIYVFPYLKSHNARQRNAVVNRQIELRKFTKPDLTDNLNKGLFDSLEGIVFKNDSQIAEIQNLKKIYGIDGKTIIELETVKEIIILHQKLV